MVPINVARVAAGEGAITELVADPLRPDVVCRRCDLLRPDPRRPEVLCASYQTLDARENKSKGASRRLELLVEHISTPSLVI